MYFLIHRFSGLCHLIGVGFFVFLPVLSHAGFTDVPPAHPYFDAITYSQEKNIVQGYSQDDFMPDSPINRAEVIKVLIRTYFPNTKNCDTRFARFSDVKPEEWFAPFVCEAKKRAIVSGFATDGNFRPNWPINFVEASKMILKSSGQTMRSDADLWFRPYVKYLAQKKAIPPTIKSFDHKLTRGEFTEIIYRLQAKIQFKASGNVLNDVLIPPPESETKKSISDHCKSWFDGCNICERESAKNPFSCTEITCETSAKSRCLGYFDPVQNLKDSHASGKYQPFNPTTFTGSLGDDKVGLFFFADWCNECRKNEIAIKNNLNRFPKKSIILKVNIETDTEFNKKYNVSEPNTMVLLGEDKKIFFKKTDFTVEDLVKQLNKTSE